LVRRCAGMVQGGSIYYRSIFIRMVIPRLANEFRLGQRYQANPLAVVAIPNVARFAVLLDRLHLAVQTARHLFGIPASTPC